MIIQENEFLKTYNDISKLWEDAEEVDSQSGESSAPTPRYSYSYERSKAKQNAFSFEEVVKKALEFKGNSLSKEEAEYWTDLRAVLEDKYKYTYSSNNKTPAHQIWCNRFMSFFKSYLVEVAIMEWFNNQKSWCANCEFQDKDFDKMSLRAWEKISVFEDPEKAQPDLEITFKPTETTTITYLADCKSLGQRESKPHGANLVIRHSKIENDASENQTISFWLVGKKETVENIKNEFGGKPPFNIYRVSSLQTGKLSGKEKATGEVEIADLKIPTIYTALCTIADYIQKDPNTDKIRTAYIINKRTKEINQTIYQDLRVDIDQPRFAADEPKDYKNPIAAADQLVGYAQKLADVVKDPAEQKLTGKIPRNSNQGEK